MKKYKLVIFDWDGTLMDSAAKIIRCMQRAAVDCQMPVPSNDAVAHIIGISLTPAIKQLFSLDDDRKAAEIVAAYKAAYIAEDKTPCPLFDGVPAMLASLNNTGTTLAVATGKARRGLDRAWRDTDTGNYFTASRTADDADSKPSPDMLLQLLDELSISADEAIMVGDTIYDMQMAKAIGMDRLGVSYGVHAQVHLEKEKPEIIVHSIQEMHDWFLPRLA